MTTSSLSSRKSLSALAGAGALLAMAGTALASEWVVDSTHVTAQFAVKHMMVSTTRGQFDKVSGDVQLDDKDLTRSKVNITIDANSINTREAKRDAHLKSPDFFDTAKHPNLTFASTKIAKAGKDKFKVTGNLTMRGVSKPVTLDASLTDVVKSPWGTPVRGVSVTGKLNRKDWGLTWNKSLDAGGLLIGEEVEVQIDLELNPKNPAS
jgi:polyisoprenoid-binding protein YceI